MRKGISSNYSLIGLYRHIHQFGNDTASFVDFFSVNLGYYGDFAVAFDGHDDFLKGGVSGTLSDTVDGNLHLSGAIQDSSQRIGCSQSQVIVAMGGNDCLVDIGYIFF